ncbi:MalY/PatB family protein [Lachnotalea glycerini]|uniref:cysteine-S-conjugate beta-lyase n=1 Tax=Lachnotalea glycerini TaxID=1763509 RepID=A0A371JEH6_9FIRM|nr:MalY/PatB family protein [Lachnotalea glycerini]RDY31133.1 pyridoxal phosphate-dependent aminotransferase [Lachnotalea glycerini]
MNYNFDEIIDRKNTYSLKYDCNKEYGMPEDVLPLWVADMDFKAPIRVIEALKEISEFGIYGYTRINDQYFSTLERWYSKYFGRRVRKEWLIITPGVVFAIALAIKGLTNEGDSVIIQKPVYYPFSTMIIKNNRKLVNNPLILKDNKYVIDYDDFENKIIQNNVKLFLFCNPHNPGGRVWTKEEIIRLADICVKHNVKIVSDEIHSDFIFPGYEHTVLSDLKPEYEALTITCTAPTKTFNLAGLQISNIWIPNERIRKIIENEKSKTGYHEPSITGLVACKAAYDSGEEWLSQLRSYLKGNLDFVREFIKINLPEIELIEPEGTYLVWLDFRKLGLSDEEVDTLIVSKAKLWLDSGKMFGEEGKGFQRINIACPRTVLEDALNRIKTAMNSSVFKKEIDKLSE